LSHSKFVVSAVSTGSDVIAGQVAGNRNGDRPTPESTDTADDGRQSVRTGAGPARHRVTGAAARSHSLGQSAL